MTSPAVLKKHQVIALINFDEKLSSLINHCDFESRQLVHFASEAELFTNGNLKSLI
jgi:methylglyoxal synthase